MCNIKCSEITVQIYVGVEHCAVYPLQAHPALYLSTVTAGGCAVLLFFPSQPSNHWCLLPSVPDTEPHHDIQ